MKNALALIAIAGMATVASAQTFSLSVANAPTQVAEGAVFTIDITGNSSFGTHMLGGGFSLTSNSALISSMTWTPAAWSSFNQDDGYAGSGNYNTVVFGQLVIPGVPPFDVPAAGSELGGLIGSYQVTLVGAGAGLIDFSINPGSPFSLQTIDIASGATADSANGVLTLNGASVQVGVVPAPSALAFLGLGGLAAGRRRR